jgi:MFS family permease
VTANAESDDPNAPPNDGNLLTPALTHIFATQFALGMSLSVFLLLPKFLTVRLHAQPSVVGMVSAMPGLCAILAIPWVAPLLDRTGRKPLILFGAALGALYALGFLWVDQVNGYLYALQAVQGLAFFISFNANGTLAADHAPAGRMSQTLGWFGASNVITNAVAPLIVEPLVSHYGWRPAFAMSLGFSLLGLVLALGLREPVRNLASRFPTTKGQSVTITRRLVRDTMVVASCGAAFGSVYTFYQPYALSLGITRLGSFFVGSTVAIVSTRVFFGGIADQWGRRRVASFSLTLYGAMVMSMALLSPQTILILGFLYGCAHGVFYPAMNGYVIGASPAESRGRAMMMFNGGFSLGHTTSVFALGWVAQHYGYIAVFACGASVAVIGALLLRIPEHVLDANARALS